MKIALVGQPNCGKSTLFNHVSGYKAETGNFSGTSVTFTESRVRVLGDVVDLVDLPGTYSLSGSNPAEREVFNYLASCETDVIINVLDASYLALGLGMTLELLELNRPIVIALNMMDEADRMGIHIDILQLEKLLNVPVVPMIANRGRGVKDAFIAAYHAAEKGIIPQRQKFHRDIEHQIIDINKQLVDMDSYLGSEALAIKLLEGDSAITEAVIKEKPDVIKFIERSRKVIEETHGELAEWVISAGRHGKAANLAAQVVKQGVRRLTIRDKLDKCLLHPVWGYFFLVAILFGFFQIIYSLGGLIEKPLLDMLNVMQDWLILWINSSGFLSEILIGLLQGISGGIAIVLPYLLPFLIGLGILEDVGYLPRVAFLMDALMHRVGLHGSAVVPFILGFGCNVPSIMATRLIRDKKERFIAGALATMIPCAARLAIVFGLVAFYLGPFIALLIYILDLIVIALTGRMLSKLLPEVTPGLIMEMPVYRVPTVKAVFHKAWFRIREFIVEAWPVLILGSVVLSIFNYFNLSQYFNIFLRPLSWALGLPSEVGVPLIFGILRKELSLIMLGQALGSMNFATVLTPVQMITFTVFVVFYMPCLATLVVIRKELGSKAMWAIMGITTVIAIVFALASRFVSMIFL